MQLYKRNKTPTEASPWLGQVVDVFSVMWHADVFKLRWNDVVAEIKIRAVTFLSTDVLRGRGRGLKSGVTEALCDAKLLALSFHSLLASLSKSKDVNFRCKLWWITSVWFKGKSEEWRHLHSWVNCCFKCDEHCSFWQFYWVSANAKDIRGLYLHTNPLFLFPLEHFLSFSLPISLKFNLSLYHFLTQSFSPLISVCTS